MTPTPEGPVVWIARDKDGMTWLFDGEPMCDAEGCWLSAPYKDREGLCICHSAPAMLLPLGLLPGECRQYRLVEVK